MNNSDRYDAIVIGSGMSGGWAAKELAERGLKTLILERGRNVEHVVDYPTANTQTWEFPHRNTLHPDVHRDNPVVSRCYAFSEATEHFFVKDTEHPYIQDKPFDWIRGYQVGGKSLLWARMVQRWAEFDFEANLADGHGTDWPIRYADLAPWYSHVEKIAGVSGNRDGLPQIPDGEFLPPFPMNAVERYAKDTIESKFPGRNVVSGRSANLSVPHNGRVCLNRTLCERGCPMGGYFSANSVTIPAAMATGNATLRPHSVVHSILYDESTGKASGVRVIDALTKEEHVFSADIIFVNASTLNTNLILLNSTSARFPNGLGNDSGVLGKYMLFHNYRGRVFGELDEFKDTALGGHRPGGCYIPRFRNVGRDKQTSFLRGYSFSFGARREAGNLDPARAAFGDDFKRQLTELGPWSVYCTGMGEVLPREENQVRLSLDQKDAWGIPLLHTDIGYTEHDDAMTADILATGAEMLEALGAKNIRQQDSKQAPGLDIHEMGGVRMGRDPKTSMLNGFNQMHAVPNVFVTDGAAMASTACQNPSLTFMALTVRAVDYAVSEFKKGTL
jgi:choline dehydrogenase-like flavoprotein